MSGAEEREWGNLFCHFCKIGSGSKVGYTRLGQDRSLNWRKNDFRQIGLEMRIETGNEIPYYFGLLLFFPYLLGRFTILWSDIVWYNR